MKTRNPVIFILSIFLIQMTYSFGQSYVAYPDSNFVWNDYYTIYEAPCIPIGQREFYLNGDTTINSVDYHKLYVNEQTWTLWCPGQNLGQYLHVLISCIRQDTSQKKVFAFDLVNGNDSLLYDFDLSLGSIYPKTLFTDDSVLYVTRIDTILLGDGLNHRLFFFSRFNPCPGGDSISNDITLIEGVGFTTGFGYQTPGASQPLSIYGTGILAAEAPRLQCFGTFTNLHGRVICNGNCGRDTTFYNAIDPQCDFNMGILDQIYNAKLDIHPNPCVNEIFLTTPAIMHNGEYYLINNLGQIVSFGEIHSSVMKIYVESLPSGIFHILVKNEDQWRSIKFIKN